jgi:mannose-6-phosphate isomerase-like protein (cupin superfamily)
MHASTISELTQAPVLDELALADFSVGDDPLHTHTADENFVVLEGTGIVTAGDRQWEASAGAIAVAPAFARHGWENTGSETLKLVGFFGTNVLINEFDEPVAPFGVATFVTPVGN